MQAIACQCLIQSPRLSTSCGIKPGCLPHPSSPDPIHNTLPPHSVLAHLTATSIPKAAFSWGLSWTPGFDSSCRTKSLYSLKDNSSFPFPAAPGNHHSTLGSYEFDTSYHISSNYIVSGNYTVFCFVTGLFHLPWCPYFTHVVACDKISLLLKTE